MIGQTNRKLQMNFKREHKYRLRMHEERLYKEVSYDPRPREEHLEEHRAVNPLRKARNPKVAGNTHVKLK